MMILLVCVRLALEEGDVSVFLESEEEEPRLTSSLLTIPTYIKVGSPLALLPYLLYSVHLQPTHHPYLY